jgi:predicted RND superfamily exporter protein
MRGSFGERKADIQSLRVIASVNADSIPNCLAVSFSPSPRFNTLDRGPRLEILCLGGIVPLAVAGAFWGLLLSEKPMCKPAMMGIVLLDGTIVNNSILLLDFIINTRAQGVPKQEAILQAVGLQIRPMLMTTVSTIIGLTPVILALAIGLERMSPLRIVAATGLIVGTFLTVVVIPVFYSAFDSLAQAVGAIWNFLTSQPAALPER